MSVNTGSVGRVDALDGLRGLAAGYIFVHHYVRACVDPMVPGASRPLVFGQAAVMLFFLLSGFVIYLTTAAVDPKFGTRWYLIRRFRRIYPPFLIALAVTWILAAAAGHGGGACWADLAGNVAMLHDRQIHPGNWFPCWLGNTPLWSLAYEWWFYLLFLVLWRAFGRTPRALDTAALTLSIGAFMAYLAWPNQLAMYASFFPLWWLGLTLAREWTTTGRITLAAQAPTLVVIALVAVGWLSAGRLQAGAAGLYGYPGIQFRQCITALALFAIGYGWYRCGGWGFQTLVRPFARLAPISYALYILHEPFVQFAAVKRFTSNGLTDLLWLVPVVFGLSWVVEVPVQRAVNRVLR